MSAPRFFKKDEVADKIVIETTGKRLGKAKEIAFSLDGSSVLLVERDDGSENQIPMSRLMGVAEYIVIRVDNPQPKPAAPKPVPKPATASAPVPQAPVPPPPSAAPAPTPVQAPTTIACTSCGAPLKPGAKFCTKCGAKVA